VDIQFTDEQELLRDSLQRLLRNQYDFDTRRKIIATEEGWSRRHWNAFAELACWPRLSRKILAVLGAVRWRA
jgi:hypothetical protein